MLKTPDAATRSRLALQACLPEIEAVPESELAHINVDIPSTTATILGALPKIRALEPELEKLPFYDPVQLERAEPRTLAMFEAHSAYLGSSEAPAPLRELVAAGTAARDGLYPDAIALIHRGLLEKNSLDEYRGTPATRSSRSI